MAVVQQISWHGVRAFTIGHSTRTQDELIDLLRRFGVAILVDVRSIPRSAHNPQFEQTELLRALPAAGIRYAHLPRLGGLRHARRDSVNLGWHNASFRGFADYMDSAEFELGLAELRELAGQGTVALMCAEAVPWRCHRSLLADVLMVRGAQVEHITGPSTPRTHRLTAFAHVQDGRIAYPATSG